MHELVAEPGVEPVAEHGIRLVAVHGAELVAVEHGAGLVVAVHGIVLAVVAWQQPGQDVTVGAFHEGAFHLVGAFHLAVAFLPVDGIHLVAFAFVAHFQDEGAGSIRVKV